MGLCMCVWGRIGFRLGISCGEGLSRQDLDIAIRNRRLGIASTSWPTTTATIVFVDQKQLDFFNYYYLKPVYLFTVNGQTYRGDQWKFSTMLPSHCLSKEEIFSLETRYYPLLFGNTLRICVFGFSFYFQLLIPLSQI